MTIEFTRHWMGALRLAGLSLLVVPDFVAPGGGRVGMDKAELRK